MQIQFSYDKKQVINGLRYHFISTQEIKTLMILVNVFAIASGVLFYFNKIRPEPFLLGSFIWVLIMLSVWYFLPWMVFKKTATFKERFVVNITANGIQLSQDNKTGVWEWNQFVKHTESQYFFALYFNSKSFFLIPKDSFTELSLAEVRNLLSQYIASIKK